MNLRLLMLLSVCAGTFFSMNCSEVQSLAKNALQTEKLVQEEKISDEVEADLETVDDLMLEDLVEAESFEFDDFNPDELLADLEEFEAANPMQDISLEDKVKLAWEYLKIKAVERKVCIIGTSLAGVAAVIAVYFAYKCYKNRNANQTA